MSHPDHRSARSPRKGLVSTTAILTVTVLLVVAKSVHEQDVALPPVRTARPLHASPARSAQASRVAKVGARSRATPPPAQDAAWTTPLEGVWKPKLPGFFLSAGRWSFRRGWLLRHPTLNPGDRYIPEREQQELYQLVEQRMPQIMEAMREKNRVWLVELRAQIHSGQRQPLQQDPDGPYVGVGGKRYDLPLDEVLHVRLAAEREATLRAELAGAVATWFARKKLMPNPDYLRYLEQVTTLIH